MNILYLGKYKKRFKEVTKLLQDITSASSVTELCFGDIYVAEYCKKNNLKWIGLDLNLEFIKEAEKRGFQVINENIRNSKTFPKGDICLMMGSLYHFHDKLPEIVGKMFDAANIVIISEPIRNLTSKRGLIGYLAGRSANAGRGEESFRFNESSLLKVLEGLSKELKFTIDFKKNIGKDLIIKLVK